MFHAIRLGVCLFLSLLTVGLNDAALRAQIADDETPFIPHEVLVMFEPGVEASKILLDLENAIQFDVLGVPSPSAQVYHLYVHGSDWSNALGTLRGHRHVRAAQLNHVVTHRETVPNDPNFGQQWHHVESGDHDIDSDLAWDVTTGGFAGNGSRIVVAVLEGGGSNYNHVDLIDNHWTNPFEIPDNGIDDDNNGYVDDFNGWNSGNNSDNIAGGGHGTSVSGMIGATGNNGSGGAGVNWDVDIMQVDMANGLSESNVIAAYEYPKTMRDLFNASGGTEGAFVVATNASWGIDQANPANYPLWCAYYDELGASGILNCGATTNAALNVDAVGDMPTACGSDYMVSVTATNSNDVRTFSGYGVNTIDLGAPGDQVYLPSGSSGYGNTSGTSFASPCVAGAIGLVYSVPCPDLADLSIANPQGAADLVRGYIFNGVDLVPNLLTEVATGGRLNVANSVNLALEGCGPVECIVDSFTAEAACVFDANADSVLTQITLSAAFSSFLCEADILCYKDSESSSWVCNMTEMMDWSLSNNSQIILSGMMPNTTYEFYFVADTLTSDTISVTTPDCVVLIPGCTDSEALNYDESATLDDGSCEYPCENVVFTVNTDCWPEEVGWTITNSAGEVWAEVTAGTYQQEDSEEVWSGCAPYGCHTVTITDSYGDGMYGSQWPGCEIDGYYALTTESGLVIFEMADPDFGDAISHAFCVPVVTGCTDELACNFDADANVDDESCYSPGDSCDDGDENTVLDVYGEDCLCAGVPAVPGCIDSAACNFEAAANVDDGSCFYVAQGTLSGAVTATDMTTETYSYDGDAQNDYTWTAAGGTIQGATSGTGLLSVEVLWESTGTGLVSVSETDTTGCSGVVEIEVDLLVNGVGELELNGYALYPNPTSQELNIALAPLAKSIRWVEVVNAMGQQAAVWPINHDPVRLDVSVLPVGLYTVRLHLDEGQVMSSPLVIRR